MPRRFAPRIIGSLSDSATIILVASRYSFNASLLTFSRRNERITVKILLEIENDFGFAHGWEGEGRESMKGQAWNEHCEKRRKEQAQILQEFIDYPSKVLFFELETSHEIFCKLNLNDCCKDTRNE